MAPLSAFLEENFLRFMHDRLLFYHAQAYYHLKKCNDDMAMHIVGILLVVLYNESRKVFQTYFHECITYYYMGR